MAVETKDERPTLEEDDGVDLLQLLAVFLERKATFLLVSAVTFLLGAAYIFSLTSQYVAVATILPHDSKASMGGLFSTHSTGTLFSGLLTSRVVLDGVLDRTPFMERRNLKSREKARSALGGMASFDAGADSILHIKVRDDNAQEAAVLANAFLESLNHLNDQMSQEESERVQRFFQSQLQGERNALAEAEARLEQTQIKTGVVAPETQTQLGLSAIADLRSKIAALTVQLSSMLESETEQNPDVQRVRSQLSQLRSQEAALEGGGAGPVGAAPSAGRLPESNLDVSRAQRDVTFHSALVTQMLGGYEGARLNANSDEPQYEIIDRAVVPETKAWPARKTLLLGALGVSVVVGFIAVLLQILRRRLLDDPASRSGLERVRAALSL